LGIKLASPRKVTLHPSFSVTTDSIHSRTHQFDVRYTCDGDNSSPEIRWSAPPDGTQSLALILEDPDAPGGNFIHWVVYSIPPEVRHLPAGIPPQEELPNGIRQGINHLRKLGYFGPCPPHGASPHRYIITLYALKIPPSIEGRLTATQLRERIEGKILAQTSQVGHYARAARKAG